MWKRIFFSFSTTCEHVKLCVGMKKKKLKRNIPVLEIPVSTTSCLLTVLNQSPFCRGELQFSWGGSRTTPPGWGHHYTFGEYNRRNGSFKVFFFFLLLLLLILLSFSCRVQEVNFRNFLWDWRRWNALNTNRFCLAYFVFLLFIFLQAKTASGIKKKKETSTEKIKVHKPPQWLI